MYRLSPYRAMPAIISARTPRSVVASGDPRLVDVDDLVHLVDVEAVGAAAQTETMRTLRLRGSA